VVVEGRRVVSVSKTGEPTVTLHERSQVRGQTVVLATGIPVLDCGLYFAKVDRCVPTRWLSITRVLPS
jgi:hypothetical protein